MDDLKKKLSDIYEVNKDVLEEYLSAWSMLSVSKKTIMTECGKTERYIYFVMKGIQKSYYINNGKEHIMFFAYPPSFSGIMESFFTQSPSRYYLETISDSEFLRLPYAKHLQFISKYRALETLFRKLTEQLLSEIIERHHELLAFDAKTRFKTFMQRSPHLLHMIPHKSLASYLRIDPTNFSKMMNHIRV